jgi:hypothetical protein
MSHAGQRCQARRGQDRLVDRRVRVLLEVAQEPARRDPLVTTRVFAVDEDREVEGVDEAELREVPRSGQRH